MCAKLGKSVTRSYVSAQHDCIRIDLVLLNEVSDFVHQAVLNRGMELRLRRERRREDLANGFDVQSIGEIAKHRGEL